MSYLLDTDWVASFLNGNKEAVNLLTTLSQSGEELALSLISYGELYEGIYFGPNSTRHEQGFVTFLHGVKVLPLNQKIMKRFARIRGELRLQGKLIPDADLLIGATALHHNLTLVTRNKRHFGRISGLVIY